MLGLLIPGVGAIYNGQYAKGLVHALLFGLLISLMSNDSLGGFEPLAGFMLAAYVFYMGFEAYHTARKRAAGEPVDEFSSLMDVRAGSSASAIALIVIGGVFLLDTLDMLRLRELLRFWPVLLIALGVAMLYSRLTGESQDREAGHERQ
ncbi:MAG: LiaI-LiaF-like domain-containing protein [Bryobacteraceae bacterium]